MVYRGSIKTSISTPAKRGPIAVITPGRPTVYTTGIRTLGGQVFVNVPPSESSGGGARKVSPTSASTFTPLDEPLQVTGRKASTEPSAPTSAPFAIEVQELSIPLGAQPPSQALTTTQVRQLSREEALNAQAAAALRGQAAQPVTWNLPGGPMARRAEAKASVWDLVRTGDFAGATAKLSRQAQQRYAIAKFGTTKTKGQRLKELYVASAYDIATVPTKLATTGQALGGLGVGLITQNKQTRQALKTGIKSLTWRDFVPASAKPSDIITYGVEMYVGGKILGAGGKAAKVGGKALGRASGVSLKWVGPAPGFVRAGQAVGRGITKAEAKAIQGVQGVPGLIGRGAKAVSPLKVSYIASTGAKPKPLFSVVPGKGSSITFKTTGNILKRGGKGALTESPPIPTIKTPTTKPTPRLPRRYAPIDVTQPGPTIQSSGLLYRLNTQKAGVVQRSVTGTIRSGPVSAKDAAYYRFLAKEMRNAPGAAAKNARAALRAAANEGYIVEPTNFRFYAKTKIPTYGAKAKLEKPMTAFGRALEQANAGLPLGPSSVPMKKAAPPVVLPKKGVTITYNGRELVLKRPQLKIKGKKAQGILMPPELRSPRPGKVVKPPTTKLRVGAGSNFYTPGGPAVTGAFGGRGGGALLRYLGSASSRAVLRSYGRSVGLATSGAVLLGYGPAQGQPQIPYTGPKTGQTTRSAQMPGSRHDYIYLPPEQLPGRLTGQTTGQVPGQVPRGGVTQIITPGLATTVFLGGALLLRQRLPPDRLVRIGGGRGSRLAGDRGRHPFRLGRRRVPTLFNILSGRRPSATLGFVSGAEFLR